MNWLINWFKERYFKMTKLSYPKDIEKIALDPHFRYGYTTVIKTILDAIERNEIKSLQSLDWILRTSLQLQKIFKQENKL